MKIVAELKVLAIEERRGQKYISGFGKDAIYQTVTLGWKIILEEHVSLLVPQKPPLVKGQTLRLTLEPIPCPPSTNTNPPNSQSSS